MSESLKRTPLFQEHVKLGARIVPFAGWEMPVQYTGLKEEHLATRSNIGLFDVSHMGEIRVRGPKAVETLQWLTTNDVSALNSGQAQYGLLPNFEGGLVDDLFIYCLEKNQDYLVCVNASNKDKDFAWFIKNNKGADITDESDSWGQLAIQGPKALELVDALFPEMKPSAWKRNEVKAAKFKNWNAIISTTGYTGENGCEIFIERDGAETLWTACLNHPLKPTPVGLGARDTLRTEMKYSLYGHEIDDTTNPYEALLGWAIKPAAKDFIGKSKILAVKEAGLKRKLIGFKMQERGIPRQSYAVKDSAGKSIGHVTSGTHSVSLDVAIGIAYVDVSFASENSEIFIDIRGKLTKAQVCKTPFLTKN